MTSTPLPAPGWYPDPHGAPGVRWWSGTGWTEHVSAPAQPVDQWTAVDFLVPTERGMGVRALVWGIISLVANAALFIPGIIAIASGAIGIARGNRLQRQGLEPKGRSLAIAGLSLGVLSTIVTAAFAVLLFGPRG